MKATVLHVVSFGAHAMSVAAKKQYTFGIMPKSLYNSFFFPVREGCQARSKLYGDVSCEWVGPTWEDPTGEAQARAIDDIVDMRLNGTKVFDGLAISVMNGAALVKPIRRALDSGMSVICFDSDAAESDRQAYVGTDNIAFGNQLGNVLLQLRPTGGIYALLTLAGGENLKLRVQGIRQSLQGTTWIELPDSLTIEEINLTDDPTFKLDRAIEQIEGLKAKNPGLGAIIPTYGAPMKEAERWSDYVDNNRDMVHVVADAQPQQITLLERGYADGLVGQLPYESGEICIDTLFELQESGNPPKDQGNDKIYGTTLSLLMRYPLVLPELSVDKNYIGNLRFVGYFFSALLTLGVFGVFGWITIYRNTRIVKAAQPFFLTLIASGVLLMSASLVPISMDDELFSVRAVSIACNVTPWLLTQGFVLVFSALFSKLWRVNRLVRLAQRFSKEKITTTRDVMLPFIFMTSANLIILACWTAIAPLEFVRLEHEGTDPWNRVISTYGQCTSEAGKSSAPYVTALCLLNFGALVIANFQAYKNRDIRTEFSESKYIAIVLASMTQAGFVGIPVMIVLNDQPQVEYVIRAPLIFITSAAILGFIFAPKIWYRPLIRPPGGSSAILSEEMKGTVYMSKSVAAIVRRGMDSGLMSGSESDSRNNSSHWTSIDDIRASSEKEMQAFKRAKTDSDLDDAEGRKTEGEEGTDDIRSFVRSKSDGRDDCENPLSVLEKLPIPTIDKVK